MSRKRKALPCECGETDLACYGAITVLGVECESCGRRGPAFVSKKCITGKTLEAAKDEAVKLWNRDRQASRLLEEVVDLFKRGKHLHCITDLAERIRAWHEGEAT